MPEVVLCLSEVKLSTVFLKARQEQAGMQTCIEPMWLQFSRDSDFMKLALDAYGIYGPRCSRTVPTMLRQHARNTRS